MDKKKEVKRGGHRPGAGAKKKQDFQIKEAITIYVSKESIQNSGGKAALKVKLTVSVESGAFKINTDQESLRINPISIEQSIALHNAENQDQFTISKSYNYDDLKRLIMDSTSSNEIQDAWRTIKAETWLTGWQNRELDRLIQEQRTKIDF